MKHVDEVRGFERTIFFESAGGHKTSGGVPLTNCVIEVVENDAQGNCPMLSLRFFHKPVYDAKTARELAESGHPVYEDDTPIGLEINLGPVIAESFIEQIKAQWPQYVKIVEEPDVD